MKDVARHAGVAVGTVSNVLNGRPSVNPELRERVLASVRELGFVRNEAARHLRSGDSRTIALMVSDATNPFFTEISKGAENVARKAGSFQLIASSHDDLDRERAYLQLLEELRVQGVLVAPMGDVSAALSHLRAQGIPSVLVDSLPPSGECSAVRTDHVEGGRIAAQHLLATGRTRIGFVGGPASVPQIADRLLGTREALRARGIDPLSLPVWHADASTSLMAEGIADQVAALSESERPDGFVVSNDLLAMGLMHGLVRAGMRIPTDVAIIGYDDIPWAESAVIPLSSVRQRSVEMGAAAARILFDEIADGDSPRRDCVFPPELVVRESTAGHQLAHSPRA